MKFYVSAFVGVIIRVIVRNARCNNEDNKDIKCMFCLSLQLLSETFLILRRTERDAIMYVCISVCMQSTGCSWWVVMNVEFSRKVFDKNIQISNFN